MKKEKKWVLMAQWVGRKILSKHEILSLMKPVIDKLNSLKN